MTPELKTASLRAAYTSILISLSSFLTIWATTDDLKTIVIGTLTPVVATLIARAGIEGAIDSKRAGAHV